MKPFAVLKYARPEDDREADARMVLIEDRGERVLVAAVGSGMSIVPVNCWPVSEVTPCDESETADALAGVLDEIDRCGARFPLGVEESARAYVEPNAFPMREAAPNSQ